MKKHFFQPTEYHTTIAERPPVLEIGDGHTVITSTVDNSGRDASDRTVTSPGNPQTGPFFISTARPGDVLAVRFDRLVPNRSIGRTKTYIAAHILEPRHAAAADWYHDNALLEWRIDVAEGTATLLSQSFAAGGLSVGLDPMLGCFGTAPPGGQCISTSTASVHGGNMDYRGFRTGTTVYLPVFVEGALFYLGDGHAAQGDGEIVGTGIEVSLEVQFTVNIVRGKSIAWPRAETADHILTVGNARPLDQALQLATSEMVRWLVGLGLEERQAHILMGQCVEYEVGNVFDPAYTMICKMSKSLLAQIGLEPRL